jgi:exonuclease III
MTETLLKPDINEQIMHDYNFFRCDRVHKGWGGVGILVKKIIKASELVLPNKELIQANLNIELISLSVQCGLNSSFIVSCLYRPPKEDKAQLYADSETIDLLISDLSSFKKDFFLLGDFNLRTADQYSYIVPTLKT